MNSGISTTSAGAGFLPSTVCHLKNHGWNGWNITSNAHFPHLSFHGNLKVPAVSPPLKEGHFLRPKNRESLKACFLERGAILHFPMMIFPSKAWHLHLQQCLTSSTFSLQLANGLEPLPYRGWDGMKGLVVGCCSVGWVSWWLVVKHEESLGKKSSRREMSKDESFEVRRFLRIFVVFGVYHVAFGKLTWQ